jgi:hypothetical protein
MKEHGTETDLYAVAVSSLQVDHPVAFRYLIREIVTENQYGEGITQKWLRETLDSKIKEAETPELRDALVALRNDIDDPRTLAGFAMKCFETAGQTPERWKDRDWAQQQYSELLLHPGLQ